MKIRKGFVSNSSSSSFLIVGVDNEKLIEKLLEKDKPTSSWGGVSEAEHINYYGGYYNPEDGEHSGIYYAGIEVEKLLEKMTIPEAKRELIKIIKKRFDIDIFESEVGFYYGECSNE